MRDLSGVHEFGDWCTTLDLYPVNQNEYAKKIRDLHYYYCKKIQKLGGLTLEWDLEKKQ